DDFSFRIRVARFPSAQLDHDFIANVGWPAHIPRRRHVNIVRNSRVIRNHIEELLAALERAHNLGALAIQDANDRPGVRPVPLSSQAEGPNFAPDQDAVAVQSGRDGALWHDDFAQGRIVGLEKALSLAVNSNRSGNEIGLPALDIAIALGAGNLAGSLQIAERVLELLLLVGPQAEPAQQLRNIQRSVILAPE